MPSRSAHRFHDEHGCASPSWQKQRKQAERGDFPPSPTMRARNAAMCAAADTGVPTMATKMATPTAKPI